MTFSETLSKKSPREDQLPLSCSRYECVCVCALTVLLHSFAFQSFPLYTSHSLHSLILYFLIVQHEFVNRPALCSTLTITLIKVLEAPPPKAKTPVEDDPEDEPEDVGERKVIKLN